MYACMYVCMCVCACVYVCMHVFMYACMYVFMYVWMYVHRHRHRHNTHTYTNTHTTLPCHTGVTRHLRSADKERMPVSFNLRDTASRSLSLLQIFRTMLSMPPGPPSLQSCLSLPGRNSQRAIVHSYSTFKRKTFQHFHQVHTRRQWTRKIRTKCTKCSWVPRALPVLAEILKRERYR